MFLISNKLDLNQETHFTIQLKEALLRLLALPKNIRLAWKGLPGKKNPSLLQTIIKYGCKKSYKIVPRALYYKTFYNRNLRIFLIS